MSHLSANKGDNEEKPGAMQRSSIYLMVEEDPNYKKVMRKSKMKWNSSEDKQKGKKKTFKKKINTKLINYRNQFVTQYITYLNIWGALSRTLSSLSIHDRMVLVWNSCRS